MVGRMVILAPPEEGKREEMEVSELFPQEVLDLIDREGGGPGPPWGCTSVFCKYFLYLSFV